MSLAYQLELAFEIESPGILRMAAIDHKDDSVRLAARQRDAAHGFEIDLGHLLAFAQICEGGFAARRRPPVGDAAAAAAAIEAEHESGLFGRAAMDEGVDAQRPMQTDDPGRDAFQVLETRPPHQRAVTEHPKIFVGVGLRKMHELAVGARALTRWFFA